MTDRHAEGERHLSVCDWELRVSHPGLSNKRTNKYIMLISPQRWVSWCLGKKLIWAWVTRYLTLLYGLCSEFNGNSVIISKPFILDTDMNSRMSSSIKTKIYNRFFKTTFGSFNNLKYILDMHVFLCWSDFFRQQLQSFKFRNLCMFT